MVAFLNFLTDRKNVGRLDEFLRQKVEEAGREFDRGQPGRFKQIFRGRPKRKGNALSINPIAIKGFNQALRAALASGAVPKKELYQTAAKVVFDFISIYYKEIKGAINTKSAPSDSILSLNLINNNDIKEIYKRKIARMRHCLQQVILATAEYIEMQDFLSLNDVLSEDIDPSKIHQIHNFVDSQYKVHVSYRSLSIALELFAAINQGILDNLETNKATNADKMHRMLVMNAVFVYEIADFIVEFLSAFEIQGVDELKQLHEEALGEIALGRREIQGLAARVENRRTDGQMTVLKLDEQEQSLKENMRSLVILEQEWTTLMEKIDNANNNAYTVRNCIADLEIIKGNASLNIRMLKLMSVTKAIKQNIETVQTILRVDRLVLSPITADDVRRFLNVGSPVLTKRD